MSIKRSEKWWTIFEHNVPNQLEVGKSIGVHITWGWGESLIFDVQLGKVAHLYVTEHYGNQEGGEMQGC